MYDLKNHAESVLQVYTICNSMKHAPSRTHSGTKTATRTSARVHTHVAAWVSVTAGTIGLTSSAFAIGFIQSPVLNNQLALFQQKSYAPNQAPAPIPAPQPNCKILVQHVQPTQDTYRDGALLEAGTSRTYTLDTYHIKVLGGDVRLETVGVGTRFDSASFDQVSIGINGVNHGFGTLPSGVGQNTTISLMDTVVPQNTTVDLTLNATLAPIASSAAAGGAAMGIPRTGAGIQLGLLDGVTTGAWSPAYAGKYNLQATCLPKMIPVYAQGPSTAQSGALFWARRAVISAEALLTGSTTLMPSAQQDLIRLRVSPRSTGAALKKLSFQLSRVASASSTWSPSHFVLRRGSSVMPTSDYRLLDEYGNDLRATSSTPNYVVVVFANEEAITGTGNVYALAADIAGTMAPGDSLTTRLIYHGGHVNATGYLTTEAARSTDVPLFPGPHLDETAVADDAAESPGFFLWSDQSEVPHSAQPGTRGGSRDWIVGDGIAVYRDSQTLTR